MDFETISIKFKLYRRMYTAKRSKNSSAKINVYFLHATEVNNVVSKTKME